MKDVPAKSTGSQYSAEEFEKGLNEESKNLVESSDQVLSASDQFQMAKATTNYSSAGDFFVDSGAADAYVLSAISPRQAPTKFIDGMRLRFNPANTNTGASTINPFALGVKSIKDQSGADPIAGDIDANKFIEITYKQSSDYFVISGLLTETEIKSIAQKGDYDYGTTAGTGAVYTIALTPIPSALTAGLAFKANIHTVNTANTPTINVNSLGAKTIKDIYGKPIEIGELPTGSQAIFVYDGTDFIVHIVTVNHPGIAKAWAKFTGSTATILDSYNISSVVRNSIGNYTVNLSVTMANSDYCITTCSPETGTGGNAGQPSVSVISQISTSFVLAVEGWSAGTIGNTDGDPTFVTIHGELA